MTARTPDDFVSTPPDIRNQVPPEQRGSSTLHFASGNIPASLAGITDPSMYTTGSEPTMVERNVTESGHIIEYNDTPGGERVLIRHRSGSGVDLLPDGSVAISSQGQMIMTIEKDMTIRITGNMRYDVNGNFDVNVRGNMNVNCLNYNVTTAGNYSENVGASRRSTVNGNVGNNVRGSFSNTVVGTSTDTALGNRNTITKGDTRLTSGEAIYIASGSATKVSAETGVDITSPSVNIAANSLTAIGATGTIGGEGITHYGQNYYGKSATFTHGVTAPTFHGDLDGTADKAVTADVTNSQNYADPDPGGGVGSAQGYTVTNTATDTTATAQPTSDLMSEYLTVSSKGVMQVEVDPDGEIVNMLNRSVFNGGLRSSELTTGDVRRILRDPANASNTEFIANNVSAGVLNPTVANAAPPGIGRVAGSQPGTYYGQSGGAATGRFFTPARTSAKRTFLPDAAHYIQPSATITENTELLDGVRLASFLGRD